MIVDDTVLGESGHGGGGDEASVSVNRLPLSTSQSSNHHQESPSRSLKPVPNLSLPLSISMPSQDATEGILICLDDTNQSSLQPPPSTKSTNGEHIHTQSSSDESESFDVVKAKPGVTGPAYLTVEEEKATKEFLEVVNKDRQDRGISPLAWTAGVKFLMARKFNVRRALELYEQHHSVRFQNKLTKLDPISEPLRSELLSGKFTVLPTRDLAGAAIAVFTARLHQPSTVPHEQTLQGVVYQLDAALENSETQRSGLVFVYDMSDSKYSHFDYELSIKILTLLKGGYPARLKKVLIVTAPLWFRAPFKILRLFVREKLRDRVFTVSIPQLTVHIPSPSLPQSLGGNLEVNHQYWLSRCNQILSSNTDLWGISSAESLKDMANSGAPSKANSSGQSTPSPIHNSSGSSGFSDDDNLPFEERTGLTILEFLEHVKQKGRRGLLDEYGEIVSKSPEGTFNASRQRGNISRNRYSDVLCFDHTRVILTTDGEADGQDYINGNFVDGYKQRHAFISTQGPLPKTFGDFWKMVWEQKVVTITMTTRAVERGRTKCGQYWPPDKSSSVTHEGFKLDNLDVDTTSDFAVSKLRLTNTKTNESRNITHLLFLSWPDYGVPSSAAAMLNFLKIMKQSQADEVKKLGKAWEGHASGPPIIVHCSAGIGRTGTLCTIDTCIRRLDDQGVIDVQGTVLRIRGQRAHSIQVPEQYLFCHAAVLEYASDRNLITTSQLADVPDLLLQGDSDSE